MKLLPSEVKPNSPHVFLPHAKLHDYLSFRVLALNVSS